MACVLARSRENAVSGMPINGGLPGSLQFASRPAQRHSLTATKWPAIAAAAAIAGDTRWVRPLNPWRPSKLRFEVEAQRSSGRSLSGFIARHIEQTGSRQSNQTLT